MARCRGAGGGGEDSSSDRPLWSPLTAFSSFGKATPLDLYLLGATPGAGGSFTVPSLFTFTYLCLTLRCGGMGEDVGDLSSCEDERL